MKTATQPHSLGLFPETMSPILPGSTTDGIDGLVYVPEFISPEEESALLASVDSSPWLADLKRRVQHYGFRYEYKARRVDASMRVGDLPSWVAPLTKRLVDEGYMPVTPEQLIVNEYKPGQGIAAHVDCVPCFGPTLSSLSIGSACAMDLTAFEGEGRMSIYLAPRSLLVLTGEARFRWKHGIAARKSDRLSSGHIPRGRRVSLTFRTVVLA